MPKVIRTLIVCSLLMFGAAAPAMAFGQSHTDAVTAHGIHINDTKDGHVP